MRKRIKIYLTRHQLVTADVPNFSDFVAFNDKEANICESRSNFERDCIEIILTHCEFTPVLEGFKCPSFNIDEARRIFPYLFEDTNPLLYRKFK